MSTRTRPNPKQAATDRAALINGVKHEPQPEVRVSSIKRECILIQERHGFRWVRIASVSQLIVNEGMLDGPTFIRVDGQQIKVSSAEMLCIAEAMGVELPKL